MGGEQAAGVLAQVKRDQKERTGDAWSEQEEAEFKKMRPPLGALSSAEAAEYVESIPEKIKKHGIPARRWANLEFRYVIDGKAPPLSKPIESGAEETDENKTEIPLIVLKTVAGSHVVSIDSVKNPEISYIGLISRLVVGGGFEPP